MDLFISYIELISVEIEHILIIFLLACQQKQQFSFIDFPLLMISSFSICIYFQRYKLSLIKPSVKALSVSSKVSMRTDHRGFLSLQYMIRNEDGQVCFVEYYVST